MAKYRVRKLTGKPGGHTSPDCEFDARRIHGLYEDCISVLAAKSKDSLSHSDFLCGDLAIAACNALASPGENRTAKTMPLAFCMPTFGLPTRFFIINVYKNC